nr:unnamed protein product [Callosobruchus chinensis]
MESTLGQNVATQKNLRAYMEKSLGSCGHKRMGPSTRTSQTRRTLNPDKINDILLGQITVYNCTLYALLSTLGEN